VRATSWGFKSPLGHHVRNSGSPRKRGAAFVVSTAAEQTGDPCGSALMAEAAAVSWRITCICGAYAARMCVCGCRGSPLSSRVCGSLAQIPDMKR